MRVAKANIIDANWYIGAYTDFLIFDPNVGGVYGLIVASGNKAGLINVIFPADSSLKETVGLRKDWLLENWNTWVYPNGSLDEVWVREPTLIDDWHPAES